jgi:hypothetical protein
MPASFLLCIAIDSAFVKWFINVVVRMQGRRLAISPFWRNVAFVVCRRGAVFRGICSNELALERTGKNWDEVIFGLYQYTVIWESIGGKIVIVHKRSSVDCWYLLCTLRKIVFCFLILSKLEYYSTQEDKMTCSGCCRPTFFF